MALIETRLLTKDYGKIRALDGVTLTVEGAAIGLLGPNGAGKSTLIKILLGFLAPTAGEAFVLGLNSRHAPLTIRQQIGYMPEPESFIPGMTAVEFVYLAARLVGLPHQDAMQRSHTVLSYVGMDEERYRNLESYSTGMKQKVKFAQALVHHPRLLLLDEPTAGLDPRGREEMLELIRDVAYRKGIHVILSTHILPDVESVCERVILLHRGRLVASDDLRTLTAPEKNAYEIRVKGDGEAFAVALRKYGGSIEPREDGTARVSFANGKTNTEPILRAAVEAGVQLRHLSRARNRLEDLFAKLIEAS